MTNVGCNLWLSTGNFDKHCASFKINSVATKKSFKRQVFEKKSSLPIKKTKAGLFSYYREKNSRNNLWGYTRCSDNYYANDKITSLWPKRSINKFFKKSLFSLWKKLAYFFSLYWLGRTSGNLLLVSTMYSDHFCGSYEINSFLPKRVLKTKTFEKKGFYR